MRQSIRRAALVVAVLVGLGWPAQAQDPLPIIPGTSVLAFDHDGVNTTGYDLCVGATCARLAPAPVKAAGDTYRFTVPLTVPRGLQVLSVRAVGEDGVSSPGEPVTFRALVIPAKPGPLRAEAAPGGD